MPAAIPIVASVGGAVISSKSQKRASRSAARSQQEATDKSLDFEERALNRNLQLQRENTDKALRYQRESVGQLRNDLRPYRDFGESKMDALSALVNELPSEFDRERSLNALNAINSLSDLGAQQDFVKSDPLLRYATNEALRSVNASMAANGRLGSGQQVKTAQEAVYGLAQERLNNRLNELNSRFTNNFNFDNSAFNSDRMLAGDKLQALGSMVNLGQNSAARMGSASMDAGRNMGGLLSDSTRSQNQMIGSSAQRTGNALTNLGNSIAASRLQRGNADANLATEVAGGIATLSGMMFQ